MEKVSVIIPCYNAERFIVRTITSILEQTVEPDEILVIDDGSTDRSMNLISSFPVTIRKMGRNRGAIATRNRAYREAKHELIASIDADCEASPTWLEELLKGFPDYCAGTSGRTVEFEQKFPADRWRALHMPLHWGNKPLLNPKVIFGTNHIYRKSALLRAGLADATKVASDYKIGAGDWSQTQMLYSMGYKLFYNPRAIVYHLRTDTPMSIVRTYWRWSLFYYLEPNSLFAFWLKAGINFFKALKHMGNDTFKKELRLIPISGMIFPVHTYYDFEYLRKARRQKKIYNN